MIYYDKYGRVMAAGAEAENTSFQAQAEDEGWIKAELYVSFLPPQKTLYPLENLLFFLPAASNSVSDHAQCN